MSDCASEIFDFMCNLGENNILKVGVCSDIWIIVVWGGFAND